MYCSISHISPKIALNISKNSIVCPLNLIFVNSVSLEFLASLLHYTNIGNRYYLHVRSCVPMTSYGCLANTTTSQSRANGQPLHQTASVSSLSKEPPIPKPKPSLPLKPAISVSSGVALESSALTTNPQPNGATDAVVYARPRPTGQPMYEVSRNFSSLVPPPPPPQRPTRPLSSILVPNTKSNEDTAHQLAQALNQSLLISKPQSVSQSSLSDR